MSMFFVKFQGLSKLAWLAPGVLASVALGLGGCLGRSGPAEEYLRVSGGDCAQVDSSISTTPAKAFTPGPVITTSESAKARRVVAVGKVKATDSLDRQAVMLASGRVMSPSLRWYWEAPPGQLFQQALVGALNCRPGLAAVWPVRSNTEAACRLTGTVTGFEVQRESMRLEASVDIQVWNGEGTTLVAKRTFSAGVPVAFLDAQSIAEAASKVLAGLGAEASDWVDDVMGKESGK